MGTTSKIGYYIGTGASSSGRPIALGSGETIHLTERFSRPDVDTLLYEYTYTDPATFTRPFTVLIPMRRSEGQIYEYACHEGNYSVPLMLKRSSCTGACRTGWVSLTHYGHKHRQLVKLKGQTGLLTETYDPMTKSAVHW